MTRLRRSLAIVVGLASVGFFLGEAWKHREGILALRATSALLGGCLVATVAQILATWVDAWSWGLLLSQQGERAPRGRAMSVFAISQFAKYLPGNVAQHVGRVVLAREEGFRTTPVVVSIVVENVTALAAGGLLVAVTASIWVAPAGLRYSPLAIAALSVGALLVIRHLLAHPPRLLTSRFPDLAPARASLPFLGAYLALHWTSYVAMGFALLSLLRAAGGGWPADALFVPGVVALAWLAGYLVPGAPAGMGVREAVLTATLGPAVGAPVVISAAFLFRLTSLCSDAAVLGGGVLLRKVARTEPLP